MGALLLDLIAKVLRWSNNQLTTENCLNKWLSAPQGGRRAYNSQHEALALILCSAQLLCLAYLH